MLNKVRLYSGLILLAFVVPHLLNHALGIVSLEVMEAGIAVTIEPWRTLPGTILLVLAALAHTSTALWTFLARRSLRLPRWQMAQAILGMAVPLLLAAHVLGTRGLLEAFDTHGNYAFELLVFWVFAPQYGVVQVILLLLVWVHACFGLHAWLRLMPWYTRAQSLMLAIAVLVPALALAGFVSAGMNVRALAATDGYIETVLTEIHAPVNALPWVETRAVIIILGTLALYGALFAGRGLWGRRRRHVGRLTYGGRATVEMPVGASVLDTLRTAGIAHASVCGGRGRCSTCRIHIDTGAESLPEPSPEELRLLRRISAPASVRLACQLHPTADLAVTPLLAPDASAAEAWRHSDLQRSEERTICVLFADLRGFTRLAESRLPYDVVFVLNRFRVAMAEAITVSGGVVNEFVGDGIMALFGLDSDANQACSQAVAAARRMDETLEVLNRTLADELDEPLRMGIGIHVGPVIVGEMGYADVKGITAVGDVVNTASRLEEMTKTYVAPLVVSEDVARGAGTDLDGADRHEVPVRGRTEPLAIRVLGAGRA